MKQYEYYRLKSEKMVGARFEEHRNIIEQYAARGFAYVGFIPVNITDYGKIKEMDLVFEKER